MHVSRASCVHTMYNANFYPSAPAVDFVLDQKGVPLLEAYDKWRAWADAKVCCDYGFHVGVTWWGDKTAAEMQTLVKDKGSNSCCWSVNAGRDLCIYAPKATNITPNSYLSLYMYMYVKFSTCSLHHRLLTFVTVYKVDPAVSLASCS